MKTIDERPHEVHDPAWPLETRASAAHLPDSQIVLDPPDQSHSQPPSTGRESMSDDAKAAALDQARLNKVYMDEMLENNAVRGKEFHASLIPKGIPDEDIGCHIPHIPESIFDDFDWFLSSIRFGRLLSKAQITLFSVSATSKSKAQYQEDLQIVRDELETWRLSIPSSFRPGERFYRAHFASSGSMMAALRTHLLYHNVAMVLCRVGLQIAGTNPDASPQDVRQIFMRSARQVIDLTGHIEVEPYAPAVLLTVIPSSAFLSLFHLVIDNPRHSETKDNVAFLEVGAGYFRRLEYVTKQEFPFSVFPKLVTVAREYMYRLEQAERPNPVIQAETIPLSQADPAPAMPVDTQTMSDPALPEVTGLQEQSRGGFGDTLYPIDGNSAFHPPALATEGFPNHTDVLLPVQENGFADFFENLLDGTYNSLYGADFTWQ
ncbi:hypothetical protein H2200_002426 [Cladophialophora chaetospira]|uniref:Uncharacterized protein n=1 Tax=Cladophialophora chaetospira TaxID=386627 RepID=A0AA38XIU8_9EURO|nr:hypothetical protein H2200_002426 [Cladophialophora chaetospira]